MKFVFSQLEEEHYNARRSLTRERARRFGHSAGLKFWASLVAQWLRIRLPMQGTRVRAPVREDPTCHGATRPVSHNY